MVFLQNVEAMVMVTAMAMAINTDIKIIQNNN